MIFVAPVNEHIMRHPLREMDGNSYRSYRTRLQEIREETESNHCKIKGSNFINAKSESQPLWTLSTLLVEMPNVDYDRECNLLHLFLNQATLNLCPETIPSLQLLRGLLLYN